MSTSNKKLNTMPPEVDDVTAPIAENVSEKPARGRPTAFPPAVERFWTSTGIGAECTTRRGKQNRWYAQVAFGVLLRLNDARLLWLADWPHIRDYDVKVRWTLLSELGRLKDPEDIRTIALQLCKLRPRTADGVAMIRQLRTGKSPLPSWDKLSDRIIAVLDSYQTTHPTTTHAEMLEALDVVVIAVRATAADAVRGG
jgi:hypothetical protein